MKRVLLTGGSGFIGKNLRESFLSEKYDIVSPRHGELDLSDDGSVDAFFRSHSIDFVVHAAVKPGHRNAADPTRLYYTNSRMFFNLERHCSDFDKMLITGSGAIYDMRDYRPKMKEEQWTERIPEDEHGFCKYVCEKTVEKSRNIYDLRIFGIFGKYEDYSIRFISNAICKAIFDLPITLRQDRDFDYVCVDDLPEIIDMFLEGNPKEHAYNITPDRSTGLLELARMVREISGKDLPIVVGAPGKGMEYSGDNSRVKNEFGERFHLTPLRESVEKLYRWYSDNSSCLDRNLLLTDK